MPDEPILPIDHYFLSRPSNAVEVIDDAVRALTEQMFEIMARDNGAGLAAVQIGQPRRVVTIDTEDASGKRHRLAMINPEISTRSDELVRGEEGCLSMPGYGIVVPRHKRVTVRFIDLDGKTRERDADGPLSVCVQHEVDHTNGILFYDRVSRLRRDRARSYFAKVRRRYERDRHDLRL